MFSHSAKLDYHWCYNLFQYRTKPEAVWSLSSGAYMGSEHGPNWWLLHRKLENRVETIAWQQIQDLTHDKIMTRARHVVKCLRIFRSHLPFFVSTGFFWKYSLDSDWSLYETIKSFQRDVLRWTLNFAKLRISESEITWSDTVTNHDLLIFHDDAIKIIFNTAKLKVFTAGILDYKI